jgi:hypothetical protein
LKATHLISGIFRHTPIIIPLLVAVMEGIVIPQFANMLSITATAVIQFMVHNATTDKNHGDKHDHQHHTLFLVFEKPSDCYSNESTFLEAAYCTLDQDPGGGYSIIPLGYFHGDIY